MNGIQVCTSYGGGVEADRECWLERIPHDPIILSASESPTVRPSLVVLGSSVRPRWVAESCFSLACVAFFCFFSVSVSSPFCTSFCCWLDIQCFGNASTHGTTVAVAPYLADTLIAPYSYEHTHIRSYTGSEVCSRRRWRTPVGWLAHRANEVDRHAVGS